MQVAVSTSPIGDSARLNQMQARVQQARSAAEQAQRDADSLQVQADVAQTDADRARANFSALSAQAVLNGQGQVTGRILNVAA